MTPAQFEALTAIRATRSQAAEDAARLVLVDGMSQADAARQCSITPQSVNNAVTVLLDRLEKCRIAAGCNPDSTGA